MKRRQPLSDTSLDGTSPSLLARRQAMLSVLREDCYLGVDQEMTCVLHQVSEIIHTCKGRRSRSWSMKTLRPVCVRSKFPSRLKSLDSRSEEYKPKLVIQPYHSQIDQRGARIPRQRTVIQRSPSSAKRVLGRMRVVIRELRQMKSMETPALPLARYLKTGNLSAV